MPKKKTTIHDEQAVKAPAKRVRRAAVTGHFASMSNPAKPTPPDAHEGKLAAERKQPDQVMSIQEAFELTLEQYEEVFKRLA